ncbi:MAG: hypothetical protein JO280_08060, partial [Mycobacteriaceae bacterium]|nr:hypothetical protein [Mycobacteriaceae bacterium]
MLVRYAALVCVIAGGLLMSGTGAVAFADDGTATNGTTSPNPDLQTTAVTFGGVKLPISPGLRWPSSSSAGNAARLGPTVPLQTNLPGWPAPTTSPNDPILAFMLPKPAPSTTSTSSRWTTVMLPGLEVAKQAPLDSGSTNATAPADSSLSRGIVPTSPQRDQDSSSPTTSRESTQTSNQPGTVKTPAATALTIDLTKPILPQLLPARLVTLLMDIAEQVPWANLFITQLLNAKVPSFLADVMPTLVLEFPVPTVPLGDGLSPTTPAAEPPVSSALLTKLASQPPPSDIAP